jgi:hypothetical protein
MIFATSVIAQQHEESKEQKQHSNDSHSSISTVRPGSAEPAEILSLGILQFESGYEYHKEGTHKNQSFGNLLIRYGLLPRIELGVGLNSYMISEHEDIHHHLHEEKGLEDITLNMRAQLLHGADHFDITKPSVALLVSTTAPTGSKAFKNEKLQPDVRFTLEWKLNEIFKLGTTLGNTFVREEHESYNTFTGVVGFHAHLSHELGGFAEFVRHDKGGDHPHESNHVEAGLTFLVNNDTQLDIFSGLEVGGDSEDTNYLFGAGFSYRFSTKH